MEVDGSCLGGWLVSRWMARVQVTVAEKSSLRRCVEESDVGVSPSLRRCGFLCVCVHVRVCVRAGETVTATH